MKQQLRFEFIYQATALLLAVIVVHLVYVTVIRPNADAIMRVQSEQIAQGGDFVPDRSIYVVLKDFEQESCFVLMFWAIAIMGYKGRNAFRGKKPGGRRYHSGQRGYEHPSRGYS